MQDFQKNIKLTIITVCYNAEQFLQYTIDSILKQTNQNFEYLIVDGASKDSTLKIIEENRLKFLNLNLISEKDKGLYDAMNKAQSLAKGDFLWFMNAGDEIADEFCVENLLKLLDNDLDVIVSDTIFLDENRNEIGLRSKLTPHKIPKNINWKDFRFGMKICHQSFVVKKILTNSYEVNNLSADLDWEISVLKKAQKIEFLQNPLAKYLLGGLSNQKHQESLKGRFLVLQKHFGLIPNILNHCWIFLRALIFKIKLILFF